MTQFLTPAQVAERWSGAITKQTLAQWRMRAKGPPYFKAGGRVLYALPDVEKWEAEQKRQPTGAPGAGAGADTGGADA